MTDIKILPLVLIIAIYFFSGDTGVLAMVVVLGRALGNQMFPVRVQLLAMCRGELSTVIARLMSKCL